jgi:hypothetical protein
VDLGDIHGMLGPLEAIVNVIGDAIRNRASSSWAITSTAARQPRVIEFLTALPAPRCVRGNHDDVLDLIVNEHWFGGEDDAFDPLPPCEWFFRHGLYDSLPATAEPRHDRLPPLASHRRNCCT